MTILLAHDPRRLTEAAALNVPLVLSGHTHGGQIVLPLAGAIAAQKFPTIAGVGRRERSTVFVSRGVGTIYVPVRDQLPAGSRAADAPACLNPPNTACPACSQQQSTAANPACRSQTR